MATFIPMNAMPIFQDFLPHMPDILSDLEKIVGLRVTSSPTELYCYSFDASQAQGRPDFVVRPLSPAEVSQIMALANDMNIPVTARGAGTGLAGGAVPVKGGIVLDMSGMNRILEMDLPNLQVHVQPGIVHEKLNQALKPLGFFFPPDPGSSAMCTIGGLISNNGSGMRCVKYGTTRNYVLDLEVVMADGRIINTGSRMLKSSAGYDLTRLMIGAEGTLGIITGARLKVAPLPKARRIVTATFATAEEAGRAVVRVFSGGVVPSACEIMDRTTLQVLRKVSPDLAISDQGDMILFEVDGTALAVGELAKEISDICIPTALDIRIASSQDQMEAVWSARRLIGASITRLDPRMSRIYVGEDVGVPISRIPDLIRKVEEISARTGVQAMKFGHIGDGNLHVAFFIDIMDQDQWTRLNLAADEVHRAAIELGGTVSAEHGIGSARAQYMTDQCGGALDVMRAIKRALDPKGILNPGKLGLDKIERCASR